MKVKVIFPRDREEASYMSIVCAAAMRSTRTGEPVEDIVDEMMDGDRGENSDMVCYQRYNQLDCMSCGSLEQGECAEDMLIKAKSQKHWGVFEHFFATVSVSEVSRALTHQLVRHRLFSYQQQSQRHVDPTKQLHWFVTPPDVIDKGKHIKYAEAMDMIAKAYKDLVDAGIKKEDARFLLTNACHTHITISGNGRNWLHLFKLRLDNHAQWEIRTMANAIKSEFVRLAPIIFEQAGELEV